MRNSSFSQLHLEFFLDDQLSKSLFIRGKLSHLLGFEVSSRMKSAGVYTQNFTLPFSVFFQPEKLMISDNNNGNKFLPTAGICLPIVLNLMQNR